MPSEAKQSTFCKAFSEGKPLPSPDEPLPSEGHTHENCKKKRQALIEKRKRRVHELSLKELAQRLGFEEEKERRTLGPVTSHSRQNDLLAPSSTAEGRFKRLLKRYQNQASKE